MIRLNHWAQAVKRIDQVIRELKTSSIFTQMEFNKQIVDILHNLAVIYNCTIYSDLTGYPITVTRFEQLYDDYVLQIEQCKSDTSLTLEGRMHCTLRRLLILEHELKMRQLVTCNCKDD
jgi:hypothetical protein